MTHSRALTSFKRKSLAVDTAVVSKGRGSRTQAEVASKVVERPEDSDPPTLSL